jgi:DNA-binding transcriptional ArsR family regulator
MSRHRSIAAVDAKLDAVFSALADPTRRRILGQLARGSATVTEIAEPFAMTLPAVSKHLRVLERAGLLRREREGSFHHCHLEGRPLEDAVSFIVGYRTFWERTLEELANYVERPSGARRRKK